MSLRAGQFLLHYRLEAKLGEGGMGVVWRGHDSRLDRPVALKVLPPGVASDPARRARFQREARAVAALNHPNIVTVYAVEEIDEVPFLVMECLEGRTLDRIISPGGLPWPRWLAVALPLVEAVEAAHAAGILHRDLKPSNIMITDQGRLKVLDFGLAKLVHEARVPPGEMTRAETSDRPVTMTGAVVGTWAYMAPEQVEGGALDERSDLFALGVVLYEAATGRRPFSGDNPARLVSAILRDEPPSLTTLGCDLPESVEPLLRRCLAKSPDARPASAARLRSDLQALGGGDIPAVGAAGPATSPARPDGLPSQPAAGQSIAVLPFANLSSDPGDEYFSDGVTEEIINALSRIKGLRVAARTSAFAFKGKAAGIDEVARTLDVARVLEGSVRKAGDRLRITAQLVDVAEGRHLWSERFDRRMDDIFAIQDEIAAAIVKKFEGARPGAGMDRTARRPTASMAAYELYLRGLQGYRRFHTDLFASVERFTRATELDPGFAAAHAGIADCYASLAFGAALPPHQAIPKARAAAERALALDDRLAEAHCALALCSLIYDRDWEAARQGFLRSIDLNPNNSQAMHHYGHLHHAFVSFELDEGIDLCRRAAEVDPLAGFALHGWMANLYVAGRVDEAIQRLGGFLDRDPEAFHLRRILGLCYLRKGMMAEARAAMEEAARTSSRHPWALYELGALHAIEGRRDEAEALHGELTARSRTSYVQGTILAGIPLWLGRMDEAFGQLERAYQERDGVLIALATWPMFEPARRDARFPELLTRMNLRMPPRPTRALPD